MAEATPEERAGGPTPHETYARGYGSAVQQEGERRNAVSYAGFLLPYLRPGMSLLDCGCGPGPITVDLAEVVAPGEVVGVDIATTSIENARALASARSVANVRFEVGNVYELPFPDGSFDAAFANTLLIHLREPVRALREIRRVLKPGGVAGISDPDQGTELWVPSTPLLEQRRALRDRVFAHNGADLYRARHQRRLLLETGFVRVEGFAHAVARGTLEATRQVAAVSADIIQGPAFADVAIKNDWTDTSELEAIAAELRAWGERPDAFYVFTLCQAVGWVPAAE